MTATPEVLFVCVHNAGRTADEIRPIRDDIDRRVRALLADLAGETARG